MNKACPPEGQENPDEPVSAGLPEALARPPELLPNVNENYPQSLLDTIPHIVWIAGCDGELRYLNPEWTVQTGLSVAESLGFGFARAIHPDDREAFLQRWQQALSRQQSYATDVRLRQGGDRYGWFTLRINPLLDAVGAIEEWVGTLTSVEYRKQTELQLHSEQEFLSAVLINLSEAIVACDAEGRIRLFNPTAREFHGLSEAPLPPDEWARYYNLYLPDGETLMPKEQIPLFRALQGEAVQDVEMLIRRVDGTERMVLSNGNVIMGPDGETLGAVVAMRDITQRKRVEAEIQSLNSELEARVRERTQALEHSCRELEREMEARRQAEAQLATQNELLLRQNQTLEQQQQRIQRQNLQLIEASRLKSQFLATMSHELRTPMHAIIGFSQLLLRQRKTPLPTQLANMVERILNNGKRLLMLIDEVLDFSKLEAGRLEFRFQEFELLDVVTATLDEMRSLAEQKNLELRLSHNLSNPRVTHDPIRIRQILVNLLSNAIKFTDQGYVQVEITEMGRDRLAITVSDTGIGIEPSSLRSIFEPFRQVDQSTTRRHSGTGLGLAITDALVQMMRGEITVSSQVGVGSTFRIELPRIVSEPSEKSQLRY